jgi:glycosyltransferase involved in cell wall biosynthesis
MAKRILQVVGAMNRGGLETWLMHVLRHIDRHQFQIDFVVGFPEPGLYDDEIRALGSKIIPCPTHVNPLAYGHKFKRILHDYGPYDVVHSHVHHYSGYVLRLAHEAGVPVRIAHSHNDLSSLKTHVGLLRRLYISIMEKWIQKHTTYGLAASREAAADLFGKAWEQDKRFKILYCGVDLQPFYTSVDKAAIRAELGIPQDAFVVGHIGRFVEQKNHAFLVDIAAEVIKDDPRAHFLLIGEGKLLPEITEKVNRLNLTDHFTFAGSRPDVPRLMKGAMDVFLFPSLYEGLGLVLIEAQAAGIPMVFSDTIPLEVIVVRDLITRLSLSDDVTRWAAKLLRHRQTAISKDITGLTAIEKSGFNIQHGLVSLEKLYAE